MFLATMDHVVENVANCGVLGHGKLKHIAICCAFCLTEHKNTVKYGTQWRFWQHQPQKPRYSPFLLGNCFMAVRVDLLNTKSSIGLAFWELHGLKLVRNLERPDWGYLGPVASTLIISDLLLDATSADK